MSYRRAEEILPMEMIELIQQYVDGESIYIPRKEGERLDWGARTTAREELRERNERICRDYRLGVSAAELSEKYFLSLKSIQRIIREKR